MPAKQPLLHFPDEQGTYRPEYIPPEPDALTDWWRDKLTSIRDRMGLDTYWWHLAYCFPAEQRKQYDLHFLRHVHEVHDGWPEDKHEAKHYKSLKGLYDREYIWVSKVLAGKPVGENGELAGAGPVKYALIYRYRWLEAEPVTDWSLLYHGTTLADGLHIIRQQMHVLKQKMEGDSAMTEPQISKVT